jgi:hypothetical protein
MSSRRSFRSLFMVASCAGAALSCYLVSLRVASERAALEDVETRIVLAQRDLRMVQTEIGTRGRLSQLERWNAGAFALSAPSADQFLKGGFELARFTQPEHKVDLQAPVVLASAPAPAPHRLLSDQPDTDESGAPVPQASGSLLHQASLKLSTREVPAQPAVTLPPTAARPTDKPAIAAKPVKTPSVAKPGLAAAHTPKTAVKVAAPKLAVEGSKKPAKNAVDKTALVTAKALTKPTRMAKIDPLAPLPARHSGNSKGSASER